MGNKIKWEEKEEICTFTNTIKGKKLTRSGEKQKKNKEKEKKKDSLQEKDGETENFD